jgi:cardiolipin synthase
VSGFAWRRLFRRSPRAPGERDIVVAEDLVTLLVDGAQAFPSMLTAIAGAQREIVLEMYWFQSDSVGLRFADALAERARAGVRVGVIYDAVGSLGVDGAMFDRLRAVGAEVHEYNPVAPWKNRFRIGRLNNRDHRKILVVDGGVAFTGGINLGLPWAPESEGGGGWRDDFVRIEGPAAAQLRAVFVDGWARLGGTALPALADVLPPPRTSREGDAAPQPASASAPAQRQRVRALPSGDRRARALIRRAYLQQIRAATRYVYIANSYFIPDREIRGALVGAARRGVDVRVLVAGESDVPAVYHASRFLYARLLRQGVALYEWMGSVFHAKSAVIDGVWTTIGSYNLDHRSWRHNLEINVAIDGAEVADALASRFLADAERSVRIELRDFRYRPLLDRVLEGFSYLFRKLL